MRLKTAPAALLAAMPLLVAAPAAFGEGDAAPGPSLHQAELQRHPAEPAQLHLPSAAPSGRQAALTAERLVVGYLPYWISDLTTVPWEHLTRISWFAVEVNSAGAITNAHGWGGTNVAGIVQTAHSYDLEVLMTVTLFDPTGICTLVNNTSTRAGFVSNMLAQVQNGGADGISIDFETPQSSCMANFEKLIGELAAAFHPQGLLVDIATPPVDWGYNFNYGYLAATADSLFIMGYNYHYTGGNPGPVDPLYGGGAWGPYCLDDTVQDYLADGANRANIVMGLPTYAIKWPTTGETAPGTATAKGSSLYWSAANAQVATYGRKWDATTYTPWYSWTTSGQAWQTWYQDEESMEARFDYAAANGLGGIGFWALGYDGNDPGLWSLVDAYSGSTSGGPVGDLVGYVREGDIQTGPPVLGAVVTLDNGLAVTVDANGLYRFTALPAGVTYQITATADCYETVVTTRYIEPNITNWRSIAMTPVEDCTGGGCAPPQALAHAGTTQPVGPEALTGWLWVVLVGLGVVVRRR